MGSWQNNWIRPYMICIMPRSSKNRGSVQVSESFILPGKLVQTNRSLSLFTPFSVIERETKKICAEWGKQFSLDFSRRGSCVYFSMSWSRETSLGKIIYLWFFEFGRKRLSAALRCSCRVKFTGSDDVEKKP